MKLLIIRSADLSSWGSCKVISPNLQKTYKLLSDKFKITWFDIPSKYLKQENEFSNSHIIDLALKIKNEKPDQLIFIDHLPSPAEILSNLSFVVDLEELPPILIHMYGDFTYFSKDWLELAPKLINHPIKFLTASSSQRKLLSHFCEESSVVEEFCFPIDSSQYFFDFEARQKLRNQMHIGEQETIIIYSGRISLQKNVDVLLGNYLKLIKKNNHKIHLWIVGAFDDVGAPFMGINTNEGYLYSKMENILAGYPKEFTSRIKFWGLQDKEKLSEIQSAADLFISLSLYHDEDYGMSPAEAMACGLPALLTDWGGYSSFASTNWRCQLMPVSITEFGLQIKTSVMQTFFDTYLECYITEIDRKRWSSEFLKQFSIKENCIKLENILKNPFNKFKGFNWILAPFSLQYGKLARSNAINVDVGPSDKSLYYQVYKNYISLEEEQSTPSSYETVQWVYDYIKNSEVQLINITKKKNRSYHHYLDPFSQNYYAPINPTLLLDGKITTKLVDKAMWTARDGLVSLTYFFKEYLPNTFSGKVAIHKDLWFVVPNHWREKVLFYDIKNKNEFSNLQLPQKIFISGMFNSMFTSLDDLSENFKYLNSILGKENVDQMEILAYLPNKKNNLSGDWQEDDFSRYTSFVCKNFKNDINFLDWKSLQGEDNFKNCLYFEMNHGHFIHDSFVKHFALSRGAGLLQPKNFSVPGDLIKSHKLSLYHSINIYQPDFKKIPDYVNPLENKYFEYFKNIFEQSLTGPNSATSWDTWMASYLKKYYKLYPPSLT